MPDLEHELPIYIMRHGLRVVRAVAKEFLLGVEIDDNAVVRALSTNFVNIAPVDYHADAAFTFGDPVIRSRLIEVQRRRDPRKRFSMTQYVAALYAEHEAPVDLIVFTESASVARWMRQPIAVGSGFLWTPTVIGPEELASPEHREAFRECPELAVLAMQLCKGEEQIHQDIVTDTAQWLSQPNELAEEDARLYRDIVRNAVSGVTRTLVEHIMSVSNEHFESRYFRLLRKEWKDEGRNEGRQEGGRRGELRATIQSLRVLIAARGFRLSDEQDAVIESNDDLQQLRRWIKQAATADSVEGALR